MSGVVELLRSAWSVLGDEARRKFKHYLVFAIVFNVCAIASIIFSRVSIAADLMGSSVSFALLLLLIVALVVLIVLISGTYRAFKRDYLARAFPSEGPERAAEGHWNRRDALTLCAGIVGGVNLLPNIAALILDITAPADIDVFNIVVTVLWIGIAIYAVPRCCERYLSPGPRPSEDSRLPAVPGISDAANPTDRNRK